MSNKPRVHLTYTVETNNSSETHELPMKVLIVGNFGGDIPTKNYLQRSVIEVSSFNLLDIMKNMKIKLNVGFKYKNISSKQEISINNFSDFLPNNFIYQVDAVAKDLKTKDNCQELLVLINNNNTFYKNANNFIYNNKEFSTSESIKKILISVKELLVTKSKDPKKNTVPLHIALSNSINSINQEIFVTINNILHNKNFQECEASWLGIKKFLSDIPTSQSILVNILSASKNELIEESKNAVSFENTRIFDLCYEKSFGITGGIPFTYSIFGYNIENNDNDLKFLQILSATMSCSHIPTILGFDSSLLGLDSFQDLYDINDLSSLLKSNQMAKFRSIRESDDTRYISMVGPRVMMRAPYHRNNNPVEGMNNFNEIIEEDNSFLWGSGAWSYGTIVGLSYLETNWFSKTIGSENGGKINNLPIYLYKNSDGSEVMQCPTEVAITDRKERELSDAGFTILCHTLQEANAVVYSGKSIVKPKKYQNSLATANSAISSLFHYILNCSRFAQMIKCIMRYKIGSFQEKTDIQEYLQSFLMEYVVSNESPTDEMKAKYPLKDASVEVSDDEARPGYYLAKIYLCPHTHLNEIDVNLSLVARIPGEK